MKRILPIFLSFALLCTGCSLLSDKTDREQKPCDIPEAYIKYYFSANGNDSNSGKSPDTPKQTLKEANKLIKSLDTFTAILFKAGDTFEGSVDISGQSRKESNCLILSMYGEGSRPCIKADGGDAITVKTSNVIIDSIELTNINGVRGIYIYSDRAGALKNITVSNCYIHEINWLWPYIKDVGSVSAEEAEVESICSNSRYFYESGAIIFFNSPDCTDGTWFENISIKNNKIERVSRSGIFMTTMWAKRPGLGWGVNKYVSDEKGWYSNKNISVEGNTIRYTGGDAIVLIAAIDSFIRHNTCMHANYLGRSGYANAGIWIHSSKNVLMAYNEAAYTDLAHGAADGEGFDIDIGCSNITLSHNYSHDNAGGGILLCNFATDQDFYDDSGNLLYTKSTPGDWHDIMISDNLFLNNGSQDWTPTLLRVSGNCNNVTIEHNLIVYSQNTSNFILSADYGATGGATGMKVHDNIIYSTSRKIAINDYTYTSDILLENNLSINLSGDLSEIGAVDSKGLSFSIPSERNGFEKFYKLKIQGKKVTQGIRYN